MATRSCYVREREDHYGGSEQRPDLLGIIINGNRGRLLSRLFAAAGAAPHPTVLLLHGIPGTEQNLDMAQYLRRRGFDVVTFHYSGSWGSDGDYSLEHDLEDANTVLDYILNDEEHGFDKSRIFAVGHSLGGFVCGQLLASRDELKAGALLMPCDIGRLPVLEHESQHSYRSICEVLDESSDWLKGTSGSQLIEEAVSKSSKYTLISVAEELASKPLLCCTGSLDDVTPDEQFCAPLRKAIEKAGGSKVRHISYPTDHFFSDYRLTVCEDVTEFLEENLS